MQPSLRLASLFIQGIWMNQCPNWSRTACQKLYGHPLPELAAVFEFVPLLPKPTKPKVHSGLMRMLVGPLIKLLIFHDRNIAKNVYALILRENP